ncbi:hypothetical protein HNP93_001364 [Methanococcus maripaludis]|uniref:Uncharacterized protein n=1 Tax=Methanococcus maripaludis TaxID=39152 RepID=A0A7J9P618_METMI|nr:hypothetical protein [Methanococcus maripaludis]MBA2858663.1 hypothetical protein [Methanococcus maripaludis]
MRVTCEFSVVSLFDESIFNLFKENTNDAITQINKIREKDIYSINEEEYLKELVSDYSIEYPSLDFESITQNSKYDEDLQKNKDVLHVKFYIKYDGWFNNFGYGPSDFEGFKNQVRLSNENSSELSFHVIDSENNPEMVKEMYLNIKSTFEENYPKILSEIKEYNSKLEETLSPILKEKMERVNRIKKLDEVLGIPKRN